MRLLGNKTKILPHIERLLAARGHERGVAVDVFAGSGAVSRRLKQLGFRVITNDRLAASSVMQKATVQCDRPPEFRCVLALPGMTAVRRKAAGSGTLEVLLEWLATRAPEQEQEAVITRQYSPAGPAGRWANRSHCSFSPLRSSSPIEAPIGSAVSPAPPRDWHRLRGPICSWCRGYGSSQSS